MTTIVIIEDEAKAARELARLLSSIDDQLHVVATLDAIEQAVTWFSKNEQPALVFCDIQLADGLCFEIFSRVTITSPIIFCTAFDEYMMDAFETNAISYLLKPITQEKVEKAMDKYHQLRTLYSQVGDEQRLSNLLSRLKYNYKTALLVNQKEKIIPVQVKDIAFFYLDKINVTIATLTNQQYFITLTMDEIEKMLDPKLFYRANRQFLINRNAIVNAERYFARKLVAKLNIPTAETIVVSKAKASDFLHWLEGE